MTGALHPARFVRVERGGGRETVDRPVAVERPTAIEVNGLGYAVMMATPADREDFAVGFALAERLVTAAGSVVEVGWHTLADGDILRITLAPDRSDTLLARVRHRTSESSCGLCGIENIEQAMRALPAVTAATAADEAAIFRALADLARHQPLNRATGAAHAAAWCSAEGEVRVVREDVGRHNAMDKLVGAMARGGHDWAGGFALLSSRCSYELVEKAALANCPMLVTISAPTDLALARARGCGLRLVVVARGDAMLVADTGIGR